MGTRENPDSPWRGKGEEYADERYMVMVKPMTIYKNAIREGVPRMEVYAQFEGLFYGNVTKIVALGMEQTLKRMYDDLTALGPKYDLVKAGAIEPAALLSDDNPES